MALERNLGRFSYFWALELTGAAQAPRFPRSKKPPRQAGAQGARVSRSWKSVGGLGRPGVLGGERLERWVDLHFLVAHPPPPPRTAPPRQPFVQTLLI